MWTCRWTGAGRAAQDGPSAHTEQRVATMAPLHRDNRYDRTTDGVEHLTGIPPQSIEAFVAAHRHLYLG